MSEQDKAIWADDLRGKYGIPQPELIDDEHDELVERVASLEGDDDL